MLLAATPCWIVSRVAADESATNAATELSLHDCYERAFSRSEKLLLAALDIKLAEARYREAMSALYPKLSLDSAFRIRNSDDFGRIVREQSSNDDPSGSTGGIGGSLGRTQFESAMSLTQPLFHGFRDLLIADAEKRDFSALRLELTRQRELLYLDIATLYHQILLAESDLVINGRAEKTLRDRIKELERLRALGQARDGEVVAAQSDLAELEADHSRIIGVKQSTKELLAFLVGVDAASFSLKREAASPAPLPIEQYLESSKERGDLKAQKFRSAAQTNRVEAARRASWPTLDAVGTAYGYEDPDRNRDWEAAIQLSVPIFDGGTISSQTAQEAIKAQSIRVQMVEKERLIERDIRVAYSRVQASLLEVQSFKKHREAAQKNYEFQRKDYALGVVSNLDVLQGIRTLQDAELQLARAESQAKINQVELEVAAGGVTP